MSTVNDVWYKIRAIDEHTWVINDNGHDLIYLAEGTSRAALIDTGWGIGDLPGLVAELTPLPLIVLNTHGHPDHTFGNGAFSSVHIADGDLDFIRGPIAEEALHWIKDNLLVERLPAGVNLEEWHPGSSSAVFKLVDGDVIDLDGRSLRVVTTPGHSHGSICLLDQPGRRLFTGDTVLAGAIWMQLEESTDLRTFHNSLLRLQALRSEYDVILPAHGSEDSVPLALSALDELADGIARILDGSLVGQPEHTFAGDGLRCNFGQMGVVYRADQLS